MKRHLIIVAASLMTIFASPAILAQSTSLPISINVNGVNLVYETYGPEDGKPIIILHGNGSSHKKMEPVSHVLAKAGYRVYGLDSRGQGANKPELEYHYADMAEDVFQFIKSLKIDHPAIYGHSDGGIIALLLEINHPETTSLLACSGPNVKPKGLTKETIKRVKEKLKTNPDPLKEMMLREPNISSQLLATITVPVLITGGSKDVIKTQHLTFIAASLKHGELLIFQDESHSSYIYRKSLMTDALLFFMAENGYR